MIREHLFSARLPTDHWFRWRGGEVSRIENLSDAAFAFSLTLLVVSLEVPATFGAMKGAIRQIPAFAACFAMLIWSWHCHYLFFRRYGLQDAVTIALNSALLFLVLLYVYPLKFMATWLIGSALHDPAVRSMIEPADIPTLMLFYSAGVIGVFGAFALLHLRAWRLADALQLDALERAVTRVSIQEHLIMAAFGTLSIGLVVAGQVVLAGLVYFGVGPVMGIHGWLARRPLVRMAERLESSPATP